MHIRDKIGPPVWIFKMLSSGYFKKVISAFQSVITLTGKHDPSSRIASVQICLAKM